jgi:hypothetical protein
MLYGQEHYLNLHNSCKLVASVEESAKHILHLTSIRYHLGWPISVTQKMLPLEHHLEQSKFGETVLLVRADSECNCVLIALNSSHKFYCQLLLVSLQTGMGSQSFLIMA